ncbi:MAG: hypothetical protein JSV85_01840 [Candidatus Bathyarchaeota archaeon]|nr:MAG: hypothetical protein JSV85_01840 [Candidatus Bathyarchaeota archaeon]
MVKIQSLFSVVASIVRIVGSLFVLWMTFGWKVRKTRRAFERELVKQGMSKEDARKLSVHYKVLKDQLTSTLMYSLEG